MTQVTINTLNNLENMLTKHSEVSKQVDTLASGMDKSTNFKDVLNNKLEKVESALNDVKTIKDIKTLKDVSNNEASLGDKIVADKEIEFKELLKEVTDEANVETSLDLTLARDINEIISQLKEAVENAAEIVEKTDSEEDTAEEIISEELAVQLENLPLKNINLENPEQSQADTEKKNLFEQILTLINKSDLVSNSTKEVQNLKAESSLELTDYEISQDEIIEFAENTVDEVVTSKSAENTSSEMDISIDEEIFKDLKIESISAETDSSTSGNLMQNQTPEEQGVKAMLNQEVETFEIKVESTQSTQQVQTAQPKQVDVNPSRIIDQITKHLEALQNNSKVNIVLNPESLGKVNIQLLTTKEGLSAQFTVTTQEARELLMKGLDGLKDTLVSHGVGVDNVSVKVADAQKSEYNADWTEQEGSEGGNKGQKHPGREEKEKGLFEKMMAQTLEEENGNV